MTGIRKLDVPPSAAGAAETETKEEAPVISKVDAASMKRTMFSVITRQLVLREECNALGGSLGGTDVEFYRRGCELNRRCGREAS